MALCAAFLALNLVQAQISPTETADSPVAIADSDDFQPVVEDMADAGAIIETARRSLPAGDILVEGRLISGGLPRRRTTLYYFEAEFNFTPGAARVAVALRDRFGAVSHRLSVNRRRGKEPEYAYETGLPPEPAPMPPPGEKINGAELVWSDFGFSWLWWSGGVYAGLETVKGRRCYALDFVSPSESPASRVRLYVDAGLFVVLQVDEYGPEENLSRRLSVRTFRKMGDLWMAKDMDVMSFPSRASTIVRLEKAEIAERPATDGGL